MTASLSVRKTITSSALSTAKMRDAAQRGGHRGDALQQLLDEVIDRELRSRRGEALPRGPSGKVQRLKLLELGGQ